MAKTLYLVDGSTYIFRAFFAIRSLSNSEGLPTNAVYGFTSLLLKLLKAETPDAIAMVFDKSHKTFRTERYPEYKANRPPPPEDLVPQFPIIREVTRAFNIPCLELEGYEADDIIGTLALQGFKAGMDVTIVSSDKDLMQLVRPGIQMLDTMKNVRYGVDEVFEKMGVRPDQIIDFLALMGDSVDNIPGVKGIGKKGAAKMLWEHDTLDGIYESLESFKGKRRENLENDRDKAYLSQELATIHCEVPLDVTVDGMDIQAPNRKALADLFRRLEFKTWHRQYHEGGDAAEPGIAALKRDGYRMVTDETGLKELADALAESPCFAFDTETTSVDPMRAVLVGMSFAVDESRAWYVPVGHQLQEGERQLTPEAALAALGPLLSDIQRPKCAQNAKYDIQVLRRHGVEVRGVTFDTMLASYLVDADKYSHNLDNIALDRLDHKTIKFEDVAGKGKKQLSFDQVPLAVARDYACEDAQVVMALKKGLEHDLEGMGLHPLLNDLELPLARVLADMEMSGVRVDVPLLQEISAELGSRAQEMETQAHEAAGRAFALGSPQQLSQILFSEIGLEPVKKTKTGFSTDSSVLTQLAPLHPLPALILDWRRVTKLKSTYTDVLPGLVHPETERIHTSFNQAVAATGRLSSTNPNLQNIPIRTAEGRRIREAFIPAEGHVLLAADYSQIELRVLAHLADDTSMQAAFCDGADIHMRTASELFETPEHAVTRDQRNMAKTINFGILYGMSAFRLAREQGISRRDAQGFIERYFSRYPGILRWKEATLAHAREHRQVKTLMGRVRRVAGIESTNQMQRRASERIAINTPVQGSAADIIKRAMIAIQGRLSRELPEVKMVMQVHDELVFEVPESLTGDATTLVIGEMEQAWEMKVPLVVNAATGRNWLEAH